MIFTALLFAAPSFLVSVPAASRTLVPAPPAVSMQYGGGTNGKWAPAWKAYNSFHLGEPFQPTGAPAAAAPVGADLSNMRLGQCLNFLVDRSSPASIDEKIAYLTANGCPSSVIDSVVKNVNLETYYAS